MALEKQSISAVVGSRQDLAVPQGEDREIDYAITDATGAPMDLTGAQDIRLTVRTRQGALLFPARAGVISDAPNGKVSFTLTQGDTWTAAIANHIYDVVWTDAGNHRQQLVSASVFQVLRSVSHEGDPVTNAGAPLQVVGLPLFTNKKWSTLSENPAGVVYWRRRANFRHVYSAGVDGGDFIVQIPNVQTMRDGNYSIQVSFDQDGVDNPGFPLADRQGTQFRVVAGGLPDGMTLEFSLEEV